jgi:hypothetical protein
VPPDERKAQVAIALQQLEGPLGRGLVCVEDPFEPAVRIVERLALADLFGRDRRVLRRNAGAMFRDDVVEPADALVQASGSPLAPRRLRLGPVVPGETSTGSTRPGSVKRRCSPATVTAPAATPDHAANASFVMTAACSVICLLRAYGRHDLLRPRPPQEPQRGQQPRNRDDARPIVRNGEVIAQPVIPTPVGIEVEVMRREALSYEIVAVAEVHMRCHRERPQPWFADRECATGRFRNARIADDGKDAAVNVRVVRECQIADFELKHMESYVGLRTGAEDAARLRPLSREGQPSP